MTVGIVGLGLIGGSMAKAYHAAGWKVLAWNRSKSMLEFAILSGAADEELNEQTLPECDLLLVVLYPEASIAWLEQMAPHIAPHTLVIDGCGTKRLVCEAGFRLAARYADRVVVVTGADPASVRDAGRAGQLLQRMGKENIRMVVNRIQPKMIRAMKLTVDDIMDRAGLPLLGIVPEDGEVVLAAAWETPLLKHTKKGAAAACRRIAKRIQGRRVPVSLDDR